MENMLIHIPTNTNEIQMPAKLHWESVAQLFKNCIDVSVG
jgi:hypothetical protein